jgi:hypothetical protein
MKISLLTAASDAYWPLMEMLAPNKLEYCLRWKFQLHIRHLGNQTQWGEREQVILDTLPSCDWLWFLGADTLITNLTTDIRSIIEPDKDFLIGRDVLGINNDSMLLHNCPLTYRFVQWLLGHNQEFPDDQTAMNHFLTKEASIFHSRVSIIPQRRFNSYPYHLYDFDHCRNAKEGHWEPGDFVLHLPGMDNARRLLVFRDYLPKVVR